MEDSFIESTYTIVIEWLLYLFSTRLNWERAKFDDEFEEIFSFLIANQIADSTEKSSQLKLKFIICSYCMCLLDSQEQLAKQ